MEQTLYDMLYLVICGINEIKPQRKMIENIDKEKLYKACRLHFLEALAGTAMKNAGIPLTKEWNEAIAKAARKNILFDAERAKIISFMENEGIWHMPLKGVLLKELYPGVGMRQMSDNDILFDSRYSDKVKRFMLEQGYKASCVGKGNHDVYKKQPVYNFELHRALYGISHDNRFMKYYEDVKSRLIADEGTEYGFHFTDEDFYIYMIVHEYKHYSSSGTGLRSLLDVYVYLMAKEEKMDFSYILRECEALGIAEFEKRGRLLCKKVFSKNFAESMTKNGVSELSEEEKKMLDFYLTSGVYGTIDQLADNRLAEFQKETGSSSKLRYMWHRVFPDAEKIKGAYPFFGRHRWLMPMLWIYRPVHGIFNKNRRKAIMREIREIKNKLMII